MTQNKNLDREVENWWNEHPFTCGVGSKSPRDLTGRAEVLDLAFFENVERRMRKWWIGATYDQPSDPLLSRVLPYAALRDKDVLDIAVGSGWSAMEMAQRGARVIGIDVTDEAIRMATTHADLKRIPNAQFLKMDAQRLSFDNGRFDAALAWGCHMHMPDTERSLREVARVLRPGGMTVAYWYNKSSWTYWFNFFFLRGILCGKLLVYRGDMTKLVSRYTDGSANGGNALTKVYTPQQLERMYRDAGFTSVWVKTLPLRGEVEGWPAGVLPLFRWLPVTWRRWMGTRWAWGLVVMAFKP